MKKYKSNYMFTLMFQLCNALLSFFPGTIIMWIWLNPDEAEYAIYIFPLYILLILFFAILGNIIHFLICLFTKHKVYLDKETITVTEKGSMKLDDIRFIIFDQGYLTRYGGGKPCSVQLFNADDSENLEIRNPSFFMILSLFKQCKNAKFKFKNYKFYIIFCCGFTVFSIVLCCLPKLL